VRVGLPFGSGSEDEGKGKPSASVKSEALFVIICLRS